MGWASSSGVLSACLLVKPWFVPQGLLDRCTERPRGSLRPHSKPALKRLESGPPVSPPADDQSSSALAYLWVWCGQVAHSGALFLPQTSSLSVICPSTWAKWAVPAASVKVAWSQSRWRHLRETVLRTECPLWVRRTAPYPQERTSVVQDHLRHMQETGTHPYGFQACTKLNECACACVCVWWGCMKR